MALSKQLQNRGKCTAHSLGCFLHVRMFAGSYLHDFTANDLYTFGLHARTLGTREVFKIYDCQIPEEVCGHGFPRRFPPGTSALVHSSPVDFGSGKHRKVVLWVETSLIKNNPTLPAQQPKKQTSGSPKEIDIRYVYHFLRCSPSGSSFPPQGLYGWVGLRIRTDHGQVCC